MIEARNIVKRYGDLEVLRGVDLDIAQGEIVSIVGPSGAGKTTLLQIIGTLEAPNGGEVCYEGKNVLSLKDRELAHFRNRNIGFTTAATLMPGPSDCSSACICPTAWITSPRS